MAHLQPNAYLEFALLVFVCRMHNRDRLVLQSEVVLVAKLVPTMSPCAEVLPQKLRALTLSEQLSARSPLESVL
ncbi:MAG: hypothetical protein A3H43_06285 [Gammaproteobacteria bacterium RIFCSPLOWO2_02_FULL_42_9]|nr:MAG: hypothetical protein A3H43_06285 [Gammaproteobacteria bacterium RIFCSPLOWO2_02_FULL_42_9]